MANRMERRSKRSANKDENIDSAEETQNILGEEVLLNTSEPAAKKTKTIDYSNENVEVEMPVSGN